MKRRMRRSLVALPVLWLAMACSSGDSDATRVIHQPTSPDVLALLNDTVNYDPGAPSGSPPVGPNVNCYFEHVSQSSEHEYKARILNYADAPGLYPGAIHDMQAAWGGIVDTALPASWNNGSTVEVTGPAFAPGASSSAYVSNLTRSGVEDAVRQIIADGDAAMDPDVGFKFYEKEEEEKLAAALSLSLKFADLFFGASGSTETKENEIYLHMMHTYYSAGVQQPDLATFFNDAATAEQLRTQYGLPDNPLSYISQVTYGREILARIKSSYSKETIRAGLSLAFDKAQLAAKSGTNVKFDADKCQITYDPLGGGGTGAGGASGNGDPTIAIELGVTYCHMLKESEVELIKIGGNGATSASFTGADLLTQFIEGLSFEADAAKNARPLRFKLNHLATGGQLRAGSIWDFEVARLCGTRQNTLEFDFSHIEIVNDGDSGSQGDYKYRIYNQGVEVLASYPSGKPDHQFKAPGDIGLTSKHTRQFNLDSAPSTSISLQLEEWSRKLGVDWQKDDEIPGSTHTFEYQGSPIGGSWHAATAEGTWSNKRLKFKLGGTGSEKFEGYLHYTVRRSDHDDCSAGTLHDGQGCVPMVLTVNDLDLKKSSVCAADEIQVKTGRIYETLDRIQGLRETYSLTMEEVNPITLASVPGTAWAEPVEVVVGDEGSSHITPWKFDLKQFAADNGHPLVGGKTYRLKSVDHTGQALPDYFIHLRAEGAAASIDGVVLDDTLQHLVKVTDPLILDISESCGQAIAGTPKRYVVRITNASNQVLVPSTNVLASESGAINIKQLLLDRDVVVTPGDQFRISVSVLDGEGNPSTRTYGIAVQSCNTGHVYNGFSCVLPQSTQIALAANASQCVVTPSSAIPGDTVDLGACDAAQSRFQLVALEGNRALVRSIDSGLCLVRSPVSSSTTLVQLDTCDGTNPDFAFAISDDGVSSLLEQEGQCLTKAGKLALSDCSRNANNEFLFDWQLESAGPGAPVAWGSNLRLAQRDDFILAGNARYYAKTLEMDAPSESAASSETATVGQGDFTVSFLTRLSNAGTMELLRHGDAHSGYAVSTVDGKLRFSMTTDGTTSVMSSDVAIADDEWHHIAISVNRDVHVGVVFYVDGKPVYTGNPLKRQGTLAVDRPLLLGAGGESERGTVQMGEIRLHDRALTGSEINQLVDFSGSLCPEVSEWDPSLVYNTGDTVSWQGATYTAWYWNQGRNPSEHNGSQQTGRHWSQPEVCQLNSTTVTPDCPHPTWVAGRAYLQGQKVTRNGTEYTANEWTKEDPAVSSSSDGSSGAWTAGAVCNPDIVVNLADGECSAPAWQPGVSYDTGAVVSRNNAEYTSRWSNEQDPVTASGTDKAWTEGVSCGSENNSGTGGTSGTGGSTGTGTCDAPPWQAGKTYVKGDRVTRGGSEYIAHYWTQADPLSGNGPQISGLPWGMSGDCD